MQNRPSSKVNSSAAVGKWKLFVDCDGKLKQQVMTGLRDLAFSLAPINYSIYITSFKITLNLVHLMNDGCDCCKFFIHFFGGELFFPVFMHRFIK